MSKTAEFKTAEEILDRIFDESDHYSRPKILRAMREYASQQQASQEVEKKALGRIESIVSGSLDGLELDNTCDVIEKSLVIDMLNDIKKELTRTKN